MGKCQGGESAAVTESRTQFWVLHSAKKDKIYFVLFSIFTKYLSARQEGLISVFKILHISYIL